MNTRHSETSAQKAEKLMQEIAAMYDRANKPTDLLDEESSSSDEMDYAPLSAEEKLFLQLEYEEERRGLSFLIE